MLSTLRGLSVLLAVAAASGAGAGVLAPSDLAASEAARAAAEALREGKATAPSSRAVDLLIEMQPRKVGVDFSERQGAGGGSGGSSLGALPSSNGGSAGNPPVAPAAPAVNRAGLFGTQATPVIVREVRAATSTPSDAMPAPVDPHAAARNNARMEVPWWLHPAGWIDAAVEHGGWIGGLAGVVLLGWAGARAMSRRWR